MKSIIGSVVLILLSSLALAQKESFDVIYFNDGTIIWGEIIEVVPEEKVKVETAGHISTYSMNKVEKIAKDTELKVEEKEKNQKKEEQVATKPPVRDFENYRKGFVGFSFGPSFPTGNFGSDSQSIYPGSTVKKGYARAGLKMNFLNLSYQFYNNIGAAFSWRRTAHERIESGYQKDYWYNSSYLAGPTFTAPLVKSISLVLKPMAGVGITSRKEKDYKESAFAFDLTGELRYDLSDRWRINVGGDYYYSRLQVDNPPEDLDNTVLSINMGFGYRFDL